MEWNALIALKQGLLTFSRYGSTAIMSSRCVEGFLALEYGRLWVEPATQDLLKLRGLFGPLDRARTPEALDEAIRRGAAGKKRV